MSTAPPPKPIRFVHNQGQPPSKRRRINAACLTCRKRKTRCAGERPVCSTCKKNGHECLGYTDVPDKKQGTVDTTGDRARPRSAHDDASATEVHSDDDAEEAPADHELELKVGGNPGVREQSAAGQSRVAFSRDPQLTARRHLSPPTSRPGFLSRRSKSNESIPRTATGTAPPHRPLDLDPRRPLDPQPAPPAFAEQPVASDETRSRGSRSPTLHFKQRTERHRVPYFRYFGPTAIVPGYKQMVVSVRERRRSNNGPGSATSPSSSGGGHAPMRPIAGAASRAESEVAVEDLPVYDPAEGVPVPPLVLHLVRVFFAHLGCNYPFLREDRFTRMVQEKRIEPILVDAVCALAARFSDAPQIVQGGARGPRSEYGHQYAQRAKAATVDTFPAPSVGAVQALLMMAYEGFGADQDSALWMYLGLAIRMAVDLGLQKVVGVTYQGEKDPWYVRHWAAGGGGVGRSSSEAAQSEHAAEDDGVSRRGQEGEGESEVEVEVKQERMNTFWAVFVLDRVISSGTGRPVTFRDDDLEFDLPAPAVDPRTGWPDPFPTFVCIIHLYGRASDLLNNIRHARDLTSDKMAELAQMENELTKLYQTQDPRLHFGVGNFKAYLASGQGTTFILMHFWFHALIIILHQPTLLTPLGSLNRTRRQLLPNSRELSMSSAKTIADILSFAELIGPTSFIGNPFTSQPMYIAACAFLMESAAMASQPASREHSRSPSRGAGPGARHGGPAKVSAKHSLLASAANQNYARCYSSLQQLHAYWGGVKYILTALDQKSKGIWDCETYTHEEYESTKTPSSAQRASFPNLPVSDNAGSHPPTPDIPPFAWSLTGATNSPNSSLTVMYQNMQQSTRTNHSAGQHKASRQQSSMYPGTYQQATTGIMQHSSRPAGRQHLNNSSGPWAAGARRPYTPLDPDDAPASPPLHRSFSGTSPLAMAPPQHHTALPSPSHPRQQPGYEGFSAPTPMAGETPGSAQTAHSVPVPMGPAGMFDASGSGSGSGYGSGGGGGFSYMDQGLDPIGDVVTYENPIDLGSLGLTNDMMPQWLDYLPSDVLGMFEGGGAMTDDGAGCGGG